MSRLDEQLCFALYAASRAFTRAYQPLLAPLGLTYPQYLVLLALAGSGEHSVGSLGTELGLDSGTLTPLLKRLEAAGHVERRRGAEDERVVLVRLTAKGRRLESRTRAIPEKLACAHGLDTQRRPEVDALREAVKALTRRLDQVQTSKP